MDDQNDQFNYALLLALYTLQGIPVVLSMKIPFLIQQKVQIIATLEVHHASIASDVANGVAVTEDAAVAHHDASSQSLVNLTKLAYNAQAIFVMCLWPCLLKFLWDHIMGM